MGRGPTPHAHVTSPHPHITRTYEIIIMGVTNGFAMPSGTGQVILCDSYVTAVASNDSVQSITVLGQPSGGTFAATFAGQTATLTTIPSPPYRYGQWNGTLASVGTWSLAVNLARGGSASPLQLYEIFDGTNLRGTITLDNTLFPSGNPTPFADPGGLLRHDGGPLMWTPLGSFTFTGTALHVRTSCPDDDSQSRNVLTADNLRIYKADGSQVSRLSTASPFTLVSLGVQFSSSPQNYQVSDDVSNTIEMEGSGSGVRYLLDPAAVQSALGALSSVGVGNVAVTGDGSTIAPMMVHLTGTLGGSAQPAITATDPAISINPTVEVGGVLPQIHRNADAPVQVPLDWIFWDKLGQHMPTVSIYPPVCSPDVIRQTAGQFDDTTHGQLLNNGTDGSWQIGGFGYDDQTWVTSGSTPTASWFFGPWKGATYRVSAAWGGSPGQSTSVTYTIKDWSGNTLGTPTVDQTLNPSGDTESGATWQVLGTYTVPGEIAGLVVVQSNGTALSMQANAIRLERTSPDDTFRIADTDTVALTWGAGAFTTLSGGPVAAQTVPFPLVNLVGGKLVPDPPASHSCEIGVNLDEAASNVGTALYADFLTMTGDIFDAWPTTLPGSSVDYGINATPPAVDGDGKGWPNLPAGEYVLMWKGAGNLELVYGGTSPVEHAGQAVYPGTAGSQNYRYYTLGGGPDHYGAEVKYRIHGTTIIGSGPNWNTDVTDGHLYTLGTDLANPPKYHPRWLVREAAHQCRRHVNPDNVVGNSTTYEDYQPAQSRVSKSLQPTFLSVGIASIAPYTGSTWRLNPLGGPGFLLTTTRAHGFTTAQRFHFSDDCNAVAHFTDGSTHAFAADLQFALVEDATSFVFQAVNNPALVISGTITAPTGVVTMTGGCGMPLQDKVESFNAGPAMRTYYFNSSPTATQDAITRVFTYLGQNLKAGARVRLECMNETWPDPSIINTICSIMGYHLYGVSQDDIPYKCHLANQHWAWGEAAWVAAGRSPSDFIRVMGAWHVIPSYGGQVAAYCAANGLEFGDEVATAPYLRCAASYTRNPQSESFPLTDRLTVEQTLDQHEVYFTYGGYEADMQAHLDQIHPHFPAVRAICYEGGPELQNLGRFNGTRVGHAVVRHPRWKPLFEYWLGVLATHGCDAFHVYIETHNDGYVWPIYNCTDQVAYVQSTQQDAIQINTPERIDLIQSVEGAAINDMAARFSTSVTPDFSLSVADSGSLAQGGTATRTVTLAALNGFAGTAALSVASGLPAGVTAAFVPASVTGGGTVVSTLTLRASGSATTGTTTLTIQGVDSADSLTHTATTSLTVTGSAPGNVAAIVAQTFKPFHHVRI